VDEGTRLETG